MFKTKLKIFSFLLIFSAFTCYAQNPIENSTIQINKNLAANESVKAYCYARFLLSFYENESIPQESLESIKNAVFSYAKFLEQNNQWYALLNLENELQKAPEEILEISLPSIKKAKKYYSQIEEEKLTFELEKKLRLEKEQSIIKDLKQKYNNLSSQEIQNAINLLIKEYQIELKNEDLQNQKEQNINSQENSSLEKQVNDIYFSELLEISKSNKQENIFKQKDDSSNTIYIFIIFGIIVLLFIGIIIAVSIFAYRQYKTNHEQMSNTLSTIKAMQNNSTKTTSFPIDLKMNLEDPLIPTTDKAEIIKLLNKCKEYSLKIDQVTGRKNSTALVADLVYKISLKLGYSEPESRIYYAASLIYDIGFLNIKASIFNTEKISNSDFEELKTHTTIGTNMVFFVPEKYREIFKDAVNKHHENLDGTGYPNQLLQNQIPYIARVIRVVESYIALISNRQYKEIHDKTFAIQELQNNTKHYDQKIVQALMEFI